jgi:hypothetical protein
MLPAQREPWNKPVSPELDIHKMPQHTVAPRKTARWNERIPATHGKAVAQFRFRILAVDDEPSIRKPQGRFYGARVMRFSRRRTGWMAYTRSASPCPM